MGVMEASTAFSAKTKTAATARCAASRLLLWLAVAVLAAVRGADGGLFTKGTSPVFASAEVIPTGEAPLCGSSWTYWSESCGTIGSSESRFCSHGGKPVNDMACATHFEPGSRGCGVLMLGCQALCKITELPCRFGKVSFVTATDSYCSREGNPRALVQRQFGSDTDIQVSWSAVTTTGRQLGRGVLVWGRNDAEPKAIEFQPPMHVCLGDLNASLVLQLAQVRGGAKLGAIKEIELMDTCQKKGGVTPEAELAVLRVMEDVIELGEDATEANVPIRLDTPVKDKSVSLTGYVVLGGSAVPVVDFTPKSRYSCTMTWEPGTKGIQNFTIALRRTQHLTRRKILYLTFVRPTNAVLETKAQPLITVILRSESPDRFKREELEGMLLPALSFARRIKDVHARTQFLSAWHEFPVAAGDTIVSSGERGNLVFVVEEGDIDVSYDATQKIHTAVKGELLGLIASHHDDVMCFSAKARSNSTLWVIERWALFRTMGAVTELDLMEVMRRAFLKHLVKANEHKFPMVLFPGFMSTRMEAWKMKPCRGINVNILDSVWVSLQNVLSMFVDECWIECLQLDRNQTDPRDCKLRPMTGLAAITNLGDGPLVAPTTIFRALIVQLASEWGYDSNSIIPLPYDWRLSPNNLEERDSFFTKSVEAIELAVAVHRAPAIAVAHSLGNNVFMQFVEWVKQVKVDWQEWLNRHFIGFVGMGAPLLGAAAASKAMLVGDTFGLPLTQAAARRLGATFASGIWMQPRPEPPEQDGMWLRTIALDINSSKSAILNSTTGSINLPLRNPDPKTYCVSGPNCTGWPEAVVTVHGPDKDQHEQFPADAVVANMDLANYLNGLNDTHSQYYVEHLLHYNASPPFLNPLTAPPTRPPLRNVIMLYGVDRNTQADLQIKATRKSDGSVELTELKGAVEMAGGIIKLGNGTTYNSTTIARSGDGTVPYASLAWAHTFHVGSRVDATHVPARTVEYYEHLLGRWGERTVFNLMNQVEPAHLRFNSQHEGQYTAVFEVADLEHRGTVKDAFVIQNLFEDVLMDMIERILVSSSPPKLLGV